MSEYRRAELKPLLDSKNMNYQFASIDLNTNLEEAFDDKLGPVEFMWEERKKVVRSEILRIIDACLPIVKRYS